MNLKQLLCGRADHTLSQDMYFSMTPTNEFKRTRPLLDQDPRVQLTSTEYGFQIFPR